MNELSTNIIISNGSYVLLMFVVLLLLFHLLLVFPRNLSKRTWKKIDYIWLGITALGLFSLASDVRIFTAQKWAEMEHARAVSSLELFRDFYPDPINTHYCMQFIKSELSPDDLDERQRQHNLRCDWLKGVSKVINKLEPKNLPKLKMDDFPNPTFEDDFLLETVGDVENHVRWYTEHRNQAIETATLLSKTGLEKNLFYFSPFLLCLAFALRVAKVTGELRNEKN
jgi:hypothetical protein